MSLVTGALGLLEKQLPKVISARTHGSIDYCHAVFFLGMAWSTRKKNPRGATASLLAGTFLLGEALLTDYPHGVQPVLPFAKHGRLDAGFAAASLLVPGILGFEKTGVARVFKLNALAEACIMGLTDYNSERARSA